METAPGWGAFEVGQSGTWTSCHSWLWVTDMLTCCGAPPELRGEKDQAQFSLTTLLDLGGLVHLSQLPVARCSWTGTLLPPTKVGCPPWVPSARCSLLSCWELCSSVCYTNRGSIQGEIVLQYFVFETLLAGASLSSKFQEEPSIPVITGNTFPAEKGILY